MSIPPILNQEAQFSGWMACFHALMMKPLPLVRRGWGACRASKWRLLVLWRRRMPRSHAAGGTGQLHLVVGAAPSTHLCKDRLPVDHGARKPWRWPHPCLPGACERCSPASSALQDQLPADPDARKSWQWSKAKKWVMHIASRLFNR